MSQIFKLCDIAQNNGKSGKPVWIIIKGSVYDVTKFLKEHPGGEELLFEYAGKDASKAFNEAGHSADAIKEMKLHKIGVVSTDCVESLSNNVITKPPSANSNAKQQESIQCCQEQKETSKFCCCF